MAIDFPSSPTVGQQYTFGGITYTFTAQGVWSVTPGGGVPGGFVKTQIFTTSSTYTPSLNTQFAVVECIGGGGGGGTGYNGGSNAYFGGGGGGSGGYSRSYLTAAQIGSSQTITVGVGGIAATATGVDDAGPGGDTSFGSLVIAKGGSGGHIAEGSASNAGAGGAGGAPGTGDIAAAGSPGGSMASWTASPSPAGEGEAVQLAILPPGEPAAAMSPVPGAPPAPPAPALLALPSAICPPLPPFAITREPKLVSPPGPASSTPVAVAAIPPTPTVIVWDDPICAAVRYERE